VSRIPREARDGLMRVWLEILRERHPGTSWIVEVSPSEDEPPTDAQSEKRARVGGLKQHLATVWDIRPARSPFSWWSHFASCPSEVKRP
jgi:hypothetical protein